MDYKILCPLVDRDITIDDCMENREIKEEYIPEEYKEKDDWKKICDKCIYSEY